MARDLAIDLGSMIGMNDHDDRLGGSRDSFQQATGDSLRNQNGQSGMETDPLEMLERFEVIQDSGKLVVSQRPRITATDKNLGDFR